MPRQANLQKFNDFALFCAKTELTARECAAFLDVGTSTLSRWKSTPEHEAKVRVLEEMPDQEVFDTKIKYALRLLFKGTSLAEIRALCRALDAKNLLTDPESELYQVLASTAETVHLSIVVLFNELSARAEKVKC